MRNRKEVRGAILGTLLGDSSLQPRTPGTATWSCEQTSKSLIELKKEIAYDLTGRDYNITERIRKPRQLPGNTFKSTFARVYGIHVTHPRLKNYYKVLYKDGRKTPTNKALKWLTDEGVALWFMDDGMKACYGGHNRIIFCTDSFDDFTRRQMCQFFSERYNLACKRIARGRIQFSGKDAQRLILKMSPYLLPEFRYKTLLEYTDFSVNSKRVLPEYREYLEHHKEDIV